MDRVAVRSLSVSTGPGPTSCSDQANHQQETGEREYRAHHPLEQQEIRLDARETMVEARDRFRRVACFLSRGAGLDERLIDL